MTGPTISIRLISAATVTLFTNPDSCDQGKSTNRIADQHRRGGIGSNAGTVVDRSQRDRCRGNGNGQCHHQASRTSPASPIADARLRYATAPDS